ncbi:MAG TPA: DNA/RNA nuclease SfsA [Armatimonadota bacterium]
MIESIPMLHIPGPLTEGRFLCKPNRFTALVEVDGRQATAHVPTSSRMRELLVPGARVIVAGRARPDRITEFDLIMAYLGEELVSVDSRVPNRLLEVTFRAGELPEFAGWQFDRHEVTLGHSRLDFLLTREGERCWVEAKSVTLVEEGMALFPDAPTARGARHLGELALAREAGDRAAAVFVIQRGDARQFTPNRALDPDFAHALEDALRRGVEVYAYTCRVQPEGICIDRKIPVVSDIRRQSVRAR